MGCFLLLPAALALSRVAERTLARALGSADKARRLALSLFFRAALGIERVFHFETLDDPGFAILSGGKKVMSRSRLGGLVRAVTTAGVKKLARATEPLRALRDRVATQPPRLPPRTILALRLDRRARLGRAGLHPARSLAPPPASTLQRG